MKRAFAYFLSATASLLLIVALLFTCLQVVMHDETFYYNEYEDMGLSRQIGISTADCVRAILRLVDYMEGKADSIQLTVTENGREVDMYNQREILHMQDVRVLYQAWRAVRTWGGVLALLLLLWAGKLAGRDASVVLARGFFAAALVFLAIVAAIGVWVAVDFNGFWTQFHYLFFDNDLWLLDYATCRMIRICPESLFFHIVVRFGLAFVGIMLLPVAASAFALIRRKRRRTQPGGGR